VRSSSTMAARPTVHRPRPAQLTLPRTLIFASAAWLLGSWLLTMGLQTPVQPTASSFMPGVRLMLVCISVGLTIAWPLMRLSQRPVARPIGQTLLDLVVLLMLLQVVIWPIRLVTVWSVQRTAAIDATLSGWLLVASAFVASAVGQRATGPRTLAMLVCVALSLAGPAVVWLGVHTGQTFADLVRLSPLLVVHMLGNGGRVEPTAEQWTWIATLWGAAGVIWTAVVLTAALMRRERA